MKMIRSFLPVGQGAFYCERFKLNSGDKDFINVVYDCGSLRNPKRVEKQIKATFYEGETIQAVFISHLHSDHINGLEFLLKYCNVEKIIFPLTQKEDKAILLLDNLINGGRISNFIREFIENPRIAINNLHKSTQLVFIKPYNSEIDYANYDEGKCYRSGEDISELIFRYDSNMKIPVDWVFIPYNFELNERKHQLKEFLEKNLPFDFKDFNKLESLWIENKNDAQNKIKKAYKNLDGSHNPNSMTLYSGTKRDSGYQHIYNKYYYRYCFRESYYNVGCLYTGDYDASTRVGFDELKESYIDYWNKIGCIQVPHHGSKYSYNTNFSEMDSFFVISAGQNNQFSHPHSFVVNDLLLNNHSPFIVTEKIDSAIYLIVEVY